MLKVLNSDEADTGTTSVDSGAWLMGYWTGMGYWVSLF